MRTALGVLCEQIRRVTFVACVVVSALLIPIAGALALPHMHHYRGLSGLDSAPFVLLPVQLIRVHWSRDRLIAWAAAVGLGAFALKTVHECTTGSMLLVQTDVIFTPMPLAHVAGGAIGLMIAAHGQLPTQARPSLDRSKPIADREPGQPGAGDQG